MLINKKINAFTMIELLVSMVLSGILIVFAFMGYNQIQKLFVNYTVQSKFISDYNQLNKALFLIADRSGTIEKKGDDISFVSDSNTVVLHLDTKAFLLKFKSHTDTFDLKPEKPDFEFLKTGKGEPSSLITNFECEVFFQTQKFRVSFHKEYDAASTLNAALLLSPPNEQY